MKTILEMARSKRKWPALATATAGCVIALLPMHALAQQEQSNACGPIGAERYDYRTDQKMVKFIEGNHFQPQVEALVGGVSGPIGAELDFMLHHIPNHHRVLLALIRYGEKLKWAPASGLRYSYECYFDRAIRFRPSDASVRMIYATYLNKLSRAPEALQQLSHAASVADDNSFTQYNVGLIYLDMKQHDLALTQAHRALSLGFDRTELRDRLRAAGKWKDPPPAHEPAASDAKP